jgi:hypothetical protein
MTGKNTATAESAAPAKEEQFPRGKAMPLQSPLYWVGEKDRYLRQLLIRDIEEATGRCLAVYYTDCDTLAQIDHGDDKYLLEILGDCAGQPVDLLLETNGGLTDATEKVVAILRGQVPDLRVVVPKRAKSNGTLLALSANQIVLGACSELGPIDPFITVQPGNPIPAQFVLQAPPPVDPVIYQLADYALKQTQKLATTLLKEGMLSGKTEEEVRLRVAELSTREVYHSHGSVIDNNEAARLGLNIMYLPPSDSLWQRFWLLRCMYEHDARRNGVVKIFEGRRLSSSIKQQSAR